MKLGSSPSDQERGEYRANALLDWALCEAAANILRVVRGAGKPYRIGSLMQQVSDAFFTYREAVGHYPSSQTISEILRFSQTGTPELWRVSKGISEEHFQRYLNDGLYDRQVAIDEIVRASLQICASRLVGQSTQERMAETALFEAIRDLETVRENRRRNP